MENKFTASDITRLLDILVGASTAIGDSAVDNKIMDNLNTVIDICEWCLDRLDDAAKTKDRPEASMNKIGSHAYSYIGGIKDWANRYF